MQEEQGQQVNIDAVLESMGRQIATISRDLAIKEGMISALQQENQSLKAKIDEIAERTEGEKRDRPIKAVKGDKR